MKRLVLTFDDGPNPVYTKKVLDVLKDNKVRATFFVVAEKASQFPELIYRMKAENQGIELHSLEHRHPFLCSYQYMKQDFKKSLELLETLDCRIKFFRPPWGACNLFTGRLLKEFGLNLVLWDIRVGDWKARNTPEKISDRILKKVHEDAIICLNDGGENYGGAKDAPFNTIDALKTVIPKLRELGYEFVTVEEFLQE